MKEHIGDEAAVVARVVDHVQNYFASTHFTRLPANKGKTDLFVRGKLGQRIAPGNKPTINFLLGAPQLGEIGIQNSIQCRMP